MNMEKLMTHDPRLQKLIDESAIRNAVARFADAATRGDVPMFRSTWTDDGQFIIGQPPHGHHTKGVEATVSLFQQLREGKEFFIQFALPGVIEIDGDEATTRTFIHESARGPGEKYYRNHAIAFDVLRRSGEQWLFASRSFQYIWLDTGRFEGIGFPLFYGAQAQELPHTS